MHDEIKYINSDGKIAMLNQSPIFLNFKEAKVFNYNITNNIYYNTGKNFTLSFLIIGRKEADNFIDILQIDVTNNKFGKLYINNWYLKCRYIGINSISAETLNIVKMDISFYCDDFLWSRESEYILTPQRDFTPISELNSGDNFLDMNFDFDYDYVHTDFSFSYIKNTQPENATLKITVDATDEDGVNIQIFNDNFFNNYIFNHSIQSGQKLVIDGETQKVTYNGVDAFSNVPEESDVFCKLPQGYFSVSWGDGNYNIYITVIERRTAPLWNI